MDFRISANSEIFLLTLVGLATTVTESHYISIQDNLLEVWNMKLPEVGFVTANAIIRSLMSAIVLLRGVTTHLYLASYLLLIYPALQERVRVMLGIWLVMCAFRSLFLNSLATIIGIWICSGSPRFSLACFQFTLVKAFELSCSLHLWYSVHNFLYYLRMKSLSRMKRRRRQLRRKMGLSSSTSESLSVTSLFFSKLEKEPSVVCRSFDSVMAHAAVDWFMRQALAARQYPGIEGPKERVSENALKFLSMSPSEIMILQERIKGSTELIAINSESKACDLKVSKLESIAESRSSHLCDHQQHQNIRKEFEIKNKAASVQIGNGLRTIQESGEEQDGSVLLRIGNPKEVKGIETMGQKSRDNSMVYEMLGSKILNGLNKSIGTQKFFKSKEKVRKVRKSDCKNTETSTNGKNTNGIKQLSQKKSGSLEGHRSSRDNDRNSCKKKSKQGSVSKGMNHEKSSNTVGKKREMKPTSKSAVKFLKKSRSAKNSLSCMNAKTNRFQLGFSYDDQKEVEKSVIIHKELPTMDSNDVSSKMILMKPKEGSVTEQKETSRSSADMREKKDINENAVSVPVFERKCDVRMEKEKDGKAILDNINSEVVKKRQGNENGLVHIKQGREENSVIIHKELPTMGWNDVSSKMILMKPNKRSVTKQDETSRSGVDMREKVDINKNNVSVPVFERNCDVRMEKEKQGKAILDKIISEVEKKRQGNDLLYIKEGSESKSVGLEGKWLTKVIHEPHEKVLTASQHTLQLMKLSHTQIGESKKKGDLEVKQDMTPVLAVKKRNVMSQTDPVSERMKMKMDMIERNLRSASDRQSE